jgi:outer membrane protein
MKIKWLLFGLTLSLGSAAAWSQEIRIGVVDQAAVFERTEEGRQIRQQLSELRSAKQKEIEAKEDELQQLRERFESERLNMTEARREEMERQVEQGLRDLQRMTEDADREYRSKLGDMQEKFQREIFEIVSQIGKDEEFTLILERSVLFYHASAVDITDRVIQKFNETHPASP